MGGVVGFDGPFLFFSSISLIVPDDFCLKLCEILDRDGWWEWVINW